ncbi:MAG: hypothetical protein WBN93_03700, partial [Acidimicrobiia bacterium]
MTDFTTARFARLQDEIVIERNARWPVGGEPYEPIPGADPTIGWYEQTTDPRPEDTPTVQYEAAEVLIVDEPAPGVGFVQGELRTEWNAVTRAPAEARQLLESTWREQIRTFAQVDLAAQPSRAEVTQQDYGKYVAAVAAMSTVADADLATMSAVLADYEMGVADYARSLARQESETLAANDAELAAGSEGFLTQVEVDEMSARVTANVSVARYGG